jgi:hypothetical protein
MVAAIAAIFRNFIFLSFAFKRQWLAQPTIHAGMMPKPDHFFSVLSAEQQLASSSKQQLQRLLLIRLGCS